MSTETEPDADDADDPVEPILVAFREKVEAAVVELILSKVTELHERGIAPERVDNGFLEVDPDVHHVRVDGIPVYRAVIAFEEDGCRLIGSWIPTGLDRLEAN